MTPVLVPARIRFTMGSIIGHPGVAKRSLFSGRDGSIPQVPRRSPISARNYVREHGARRTQDTHRHVQARVFVCVVLLENDLLTTVQHDSTYSKHVSPPGGGRYILLLYLMTTCIALSRGAVPTNQFKVSASVQERCEICPPPRRVACLARVQRCSVTRPEPLGSLDTPRSNPPPPPCSQQVYPLVVCFPQAINLLTTTHRGERNLVPRGAGCCPEHHPIRESPIALAWLLSPRLLITASSCGWPSRFSRIVSSWAPWHTTINDRSDGDD